MVTSSIDNLLRVAEDALSVNDVDGAYGAIHGLRAFYKNGQKTNPNDHRYLRFETLDKKYHLMVKK
jgi:hypothetical protein